MIAALFSVLAGFVFLILGADRFIAGSAATAKKFNVSERWIGLTVVAFGTSLPELLVTLYAMAQNSPDIAVSNVLGSNVANAWLAIGFCAIFCRISDKSAPISFAFWMNPLMAAVLAGFGLFSGFPSVLPRWIPGLFLISSVVYLFFFSKESQPEDFNEELGAIQYSAKVVVMGLAGLVAILIGSKLVVDGTVLICEHFKLTQTLLGFTLVAIGTSLPEIAASVAAMSKGKYGMAVNNILGSNLINIGIVLGSTCIFGSLTISSLNLAGIIGCAVSGLSLIFYFRSRSIGIDKVIGVFYIAAYIAVLNLIV